MRYAHTKQVTSSFIEAVEKTKMELAKEGFGILTEINVKETLKKKLDIEYGEYLILGACNPVLSYKALQAEKQIGLFLPCNVIVYEDKRSVFVSAIVPTVAMDAIDNEKVLEVAKEADEKLRSVIDNL